MALHTVIIDSKLKPMKTTFPPIQSEKSVEEYWLYRVKNNIGLLNDTSIDVYKPLYTVANGPYTERSPNAILEAFLWAYYRHHDIVLSPDDMWLLVCMYFSQYVNQNAEQLRPIFVEHQGKILLKTTDSQDGNNWDEFFDGIKTMIAKNTKNDVCELLTANFSTTRKVESILSTASMMCVFKSYFDYRRSVGPCGIRQVHFMGTLNDWQILREKTQQLKSLSNHSFQKYIDGVLPIFDQFIETYKGNVNRRFWRKVCDIKREKTRKVSGCTVSIHRVSVSIEHLTGWLAQLFGRKEILAEHLSEVSLPYIDVPVEFTRPSAEKKTLCHIVGGFHGVYSTENHYKPVMSLSVIEETSEKHCHTNESWSLQYIFTNVALFRQYITRFALYGVRLFS